MTKSHQPTTVGHVAAAPGTKIVLLHADYMEGDAAAEDCLVSTRELPVICWEVRRNNYGTWANPVASEIIDEYEAYVLVMPDGQIDLTAPFGFEEEPPEGKTIEDMVNWLDRQTRADIRRAHCMDCGKDLRRSDIWGLESDTPILQDVVWDSIAHTTNGRGMLCKADMEKRLGRPLTAQDVKRRPPSHA